MEGVLSLCRATVRIFYSPRRLGDSLGESYPFADIQSMYSATPVDWAKWIFVDIFLFIILYFFRSSLPHLYLLSISLSLSPHDQHLIFSGVLSIFCLDIIINKSGWQHGFSWFSLSLSTRSYNSSSLAVLPNSILCPPRDDVNKFLLVDQHWHVYVLT